MAAWLERDEWRAFSDFLALGGAALCVIIGLILAVAGADRAIAFHGCILLGVALLAFLYILTQVMEKKETHDATSYADGVIRAGVVEQTAREAGIDTWQAEMKPAGKID